MFFRNSSRGTVYCSRASAGTQTAFSRPPASCAQHRQTAVLVLAARALHRAEHEVPGREDRRRQAQRLEVVRKVGGLGLARGHDAEHPAQVFLQGGVQQGAARRGQAEQRRRARGAARLAAIF